MPTVPIPRRRTLVLVMVGVLLPTVFLLVRSVRLQREMLDFQNRILAEYARYSVDYAVAEVQSLIRAREREVHMHFHMLAMLQEFVPETELGRIEHTYPLIEHAFL